MKLLVFEQNEQLFVKELEFVLNVKELLVQFFNGEKLSREKENKEKLSREWI